MPRFVILTHDYPQLHWDFFLEEGEVLRGWRLAEEPAGGKSVAATVQPNHRKPYLDYEGHVSGNRGSVTRWDFGEYEVVQQNSLVLILQITGTRLRGRVELQHVVEDKWMLKYQNT